MNDGGQPRWHGGIDRWVLIIGGVIAVIAAVWAIRSLRQPPPTPTPVATMIAEVTPSPTFNASPTVAAPATPAVAEITPPAATTPAPLQPESVEIANLGPGATLSAEAPGPISGVAPPGSAVAISEGGVILAQTTADEGGDWQLDLPALAPGQHELTLAAADAEGQTLGQAQTLTVVAVPAASVIAPVINAPAIAPTEGEPTTIGGVAPPGSTVTVYEGDAILGEAAADANGAWSLALPGLAAGQHTLEATATDASGQPFGQPASIAVNIEPAPVAAVEPTPASGEATPVAGVTPAPPTEATPPPAFAAPVLLSNLASPLDNSLPTFRGAAAPGAEVVIFEGDKRLGETVAGLRGNWLVVPDKPLAPGERQLQIAITAPEAGHPETIDVNIIISEKARPLTPPRLEKPRRSRLGVGNQLTGRAPARTTVEIMDDDEVIGVVETGPRGRWSLRLPADTPAGEHTFRIVVRGPDGETLAESAPITLQVINTGSPRLLPPTGGRHP